MQYVASIMAVQKISVIVAALNPQKKVGVIIASTAITPLALSLAEH
jgi:hypothetical protein